MKKLYDKNQLTFALAWIGAYVVLLSLADDASRSLGMEKLVTLPLCAAMTALLWIWTGRNGLRETFGLCAFTGRAADWLWFLPLAVLGSVNLWNGLRLNLSVPESALYAGSMLCVGFLEEVIFRGFLFKALCRDNIRRAVAISSLTFGIGHIVNLLNGAALGPTLVQICYACAIGFLFTVIFWRSGSLWPCILTHSAINSLSTFSAEGPQAFELFRAAALAIVAAAYAVWIIKRTAPKTE